MSKSSTVKTLSLRRAGARRLAAAALLPGALGITAAPGSAAADSVVPQMPEVVVSASRVPLPAEEVGSAVTVITEEEIARQQVRIVSDVLRTVPGLAVSRAGPIGSITQVRIRGAEANQTLVIIDGVEVNDPSGASEFNFGNLLAADIERIEVVRGPQSALYGSDAIGGVINIVTKRGRGPATARLSVEGGSYDTGQAAAALRGAGARYHFSLGATAFSTAGVSAAPEAEGNDEADGHRNQTYNGKLGFEPVENLEISLFGRYVKSTVEFDDQPAVAGLIRTVDADTRLESRQRLGRAEAKLHLFDGAWTHAVGAGTNVAKADTFTNGAVTFEAEGAKTRFDYQSTLAFDTPSVAAASHVLTVLLEREDDSQVTRSAFGDSDLGVTSYAVVGEYRLGLWDSLFLSGSVRGDDNEIFEDATTYRTTAAYLHEPTATRLHGSYGTGVKNPTLFELFGFGPNFVPNPNLRPESSTGWDVGVEQTLFADRLVLDVTYFNNRITDLIQGAGNTAVNVAGTSAIEGVEVSARARLAAGLSLRAQYTYTDGQDANGLQLIRRARHLANAGVGYVFHDGRGSVDFGVTYNGKQRDLQFSNFFINQDHVTLGAFTLIDVAASYEIGDGIEVFGRVENALDEDYQEVVGFANPGIGAFAGLRFRLF